MKHLIPSLSLLLAIFLLTFANGAAINRLAQEWQTQIAYAGTLSAENRWEEALSAMEKSHRDWSSRQQYLHIVLRHDLIDRAQEMYHRAMAYAASRESAEFQAETAGLCTQLALLAEIEALSLKNLL